jgi:hypothetical protein
MLNTNTDIVIIDLRNNTVGEVLMKLISNRLEKNSRICYGTQQNPGGNIETGQVYYAWLDKTDPLKLTYYFYPSEFHHRHQTISSINKRLIVSRMTPVSHKPPPIMYPPPKPRQPLKGMKDVRSKVWFVFDVYVVESNY